MHTDTNHKVIQIGTPTRNTHLSTLRYEHAMELLVGRKPCGLVGHLKGLIRTFCQFYQLKCLSRCTLSIVDQCLTDLFKLGVTKGIQVIRTTVVILGTKINWQTASCVNQLIHVAVVYWANSLLAMLVVNYVPIHP